MGFFSKIGNVAKKVATVGLGAPLAIAASPILPGMMAAKEKKKAAEEAIAAGAAGDTFAPYRKGYADILSKLYGLNQGDAAGGGGVPGKAPSEGASDFIMNLPGMKAAIEASTKATSRAASAGGYRSSGRLLHEISQSTAGLVKGRAGEEIDRLSMLAGAGFGPRDNTQAILAKGQAKAQPWEDLGSIFGAGLGLLA